jgi:hypothetical protein
LKERLGTVLCSLDEVLPRIKGRREFDSGRDGEGWYDVKQQEARVEVHR